MGKVIAAEPLWGGGWRVQFADKSIHVIAKDHPSAKDADRAWMNYWDIDEPNRLQSVACPENG